MRFLGLALALGAAIWLVVVFPWILLVAAIMGGLTIASRA